MLKRRSFLTLLVAWCTASPLAAHSPLQNLSPPDGATLADTPDQVTMAFKGTIRLTRMTLAHAGGPPGDLNLSGHEGFLSIYEIAVPQHGAGLYQFEWRGLGSDGHVMKGNFQYLIEK